MLKKLKYYYLYVALPFALLLLGVVLYFDAIRMTIVNNPHPQINYAIFVIILFGGALIIRSVHRLMQEARALAEFSEAVRSGIDIQTLQEMSLNYDVDIAYVLRMLAASGGRAITHQEQIAIEHELEKASRRLYGRNALPQFLTGLLVGMGLLGTFIGLLAVVSDISALIGSFADVDMSAANPMEVFRNMIERMKAPMRSMGIAFSASLYGLLGSIILGLMMVGIRRCLGDILSLLGSEVAQHIEFALSHEGFAYSKGALKKGLGRLQSILSANDVLARPVTELPAVMPAGEQLPAGAPAPLVPGATGTPTVALAHQSASTGEATDEATVSSIRASGVGDGADNRILLRIEDRLSEFTRLQMRSLTAEIDDFQKQRADMLRTLADHTEASNNFRSELQRVGRQMGAMLGIMEKGNDEVLSQLTELIVRIGDASIESRNLMAVQIEEQRKSNALLAAPKQ